LAVTAGGNVPHQIPPLERFEISGRWRNGGVIESDNLKCGGHGGVLWAAVKALSLYCRTPF